MMGTEARGLMSSGLIYGCRSILCRLILYLIYSQSGYDTWRLEDLYLIVINIETPSVQFGGSCAKTYKEKLN